MKQEVHIGIAVTARIKTGMKVRVEASSQKFCLTLQVKV